MLLWISCFALFVGVPRGVFSRERLCLLLPREAVQGEKWKRKHQNSKLQIPKRGFHHKLTKKKKIHLPP